METGRRKFDALLTSSVGGFLNSVRVLHIDRPLGGTVVNASSQLLQLLCVLPRNCLTHFSSDVPLERSTPGLLLRTQTQLQLMSVQSQHLGLPSSPPGKDYVNGSLKRLVTLVIFANGQEEDGYATWLPDLAALRNLEITRAADMLATPTFNGWASAV